jgi:hypothetical protein
MFAGIGDARHLLATMVDIGVQLEDKPSHFNSTPRTHLTAVDTNATALARDLIVFFALEELSSIPLGHHATNERARQLLAMLHFLLWATVSNMSAHQLCISDLRFVGYASLRTRRDDRDYAASAREVARERSSGAAIEPLLALHGVCSGQTHFRQLYVLARPGSYRAVYGQYDPDRVSISTVRLNILDNPKIRETLPSSSIDHLQV